MTIPSTSIPATMRALQQTSLNGPRDMRLITDAPVPRPAEHEVLIRVTAAGVNFADISRARGTFPGGPRPPYLAGFEAAGEIVATGDAVAGPRPGARVEHDTNWIGAASLDLARCRTALGGWNRAETAG